jgi:amidase
LSAIEVDGEPMSQLEASLLHSIIFNLTGHPVVRIPIGSSSDELPIRVGRCRQEVVLLDVAIMIPSGGDG